MSDDARVEASARRMDERLSIAYVPWDQRSDDDKRGWLDAARDVLAAADAVPGFVTVSKDDLLRILDALESFAAWQGSSVADRLRNQAEGIE